MFSRLLKTKSLYLCLKLLTLLQTSQIWQTIPVLRESLNLDWYQDHSWSILIVVFIYPRGSGWPGEGGILEGVDGQGRGESSREWTARVRVRSDHLFIVGHYIHVAFLFR